MSHLQKSLKSKTQSEAGLFACLSVCLSLFPKPHVMGYVLHGQCCTASCVSTVLFKFVFSETKSRPQASDQISKKQTSLQVWFQISGAAVARKMWMLCMAAAWSAPWSGNTIQHNGHLPRCHHSAQKKDQAFIFSVVQVLDTKSAACIPLSHGWYELIV